VLLHFRVQRFGTKPKQPPFGRAFINQMLVQPHIMLELRSIEAQSTGDITTMSPLRVRYFISFPVLADVILRDSESSLLGIAQVYLGRKGIRWFHPTGELCQCLRSSNILSEETWSDEIVHFSAIVLELVNLQAVCTLLKKGCLSSLCREKVSTVVCRYG